MFDMCFIVSSPKRMGSGILSLILCSSMLAIADQNEQNYTLEEVIVKAHRRAQNIETIGASITAFSGERFQELAFRTVTDLSEQVPNLTFATPAGESTNPALSLRGVGLNDLSDSNEGPVAFYATGNAANGNFLNSFDFIYTGADTADNVPVPVAPITWGRLKSGTLFSR